MLRNFKEVEKFMNNMSRYRHNCKYCGHTIYMSEKHSKTICNWCHRTNYINEKEEFKNKVKSALKKC